MRNFFSARQMSVFYPVSGLQQCERPEVELVLKAIEDHSLSKLAELLQSEELVNCQGGESHITPLQKAIKEQCLECSEYILNLDAQLYRTDQVGKSSLHYAAISGNLSILTLLLDQKSCINVDPKDQSSSTPLHDASAVGFLDSVFLLLERGANPNLRDQRGETALHKAAKGNHISCVRELMRAGGDITQQDKQRTSPLKYLVQKGSFNKLLDSCMRKSVRSNGFPVTFDYDPIVAPYKSKQMKILSFIIDVGRPDFLRHPTFYSFLLVKWERIKWFVYTYFAFYGVYAICVYMLIAYRLISNKQPKEPQIQESKMWQQISFPIEQTEQPPFPPAIISNESIAVIKAMIIFLSLCMIITKFRFIRNEGFKYFLSPSAFISIVNLLVVLSYVLMIVFNHESLEYWEHNFITVIIFTMCLDIIVLFGKHPSYGIYVSMFSQVAKAFVKVLIIYLALLLSFALSFYVAFEADKTRENLTTNFVETFLQTLAMMLGEMDLENLLASGLPVTSHILLFLFIIFIAITLNNLLVALAVSNIHDLRQTASQLRLNSMVDTISSVEHLTSSCLWRKLKGFSSIDTAKNQVRMWQLPESEGPGGKIIVAPCGESQVENFDDVDLVTTVQRIRLKIRKMSFRRQGHINVPQRLIDATQSCFERMKDDGCPARRRKIAKTRRKQDDKSRFSFNVRRKLSKYILNRNRSS